MVDDQFTTEKMRSVTHGLVFGTTKLLVYIQGLILSADTEHYRRDSGATNDVVVVWFFLVFLKLLMLGVSLLACAMYACLACESLNYIWSQRQVQQL